MCKIIQYREKRDLLYLYISLIFVIILFIGLLFIPKSHAVTLEWDDAQTGPVTGYILYFNEKDEIDTPYVAVVAFPTKTITIPENTLIPVTTYEFWVTAYNLDGESENSEMVEYTTGGFKPPVVNLPTIYVPSPPGAIINLKVVVE